MLSMPGAQVIPAVPPAEKLALPVRDIERIGYAAAWEAVRPQAIHRIQTHNGVPGAWHRFNDLCHGLPATPSVLAYLVDDDPTMLSRVLWSPTEYPSARMLLDRAIAQSLDGPVVPLTDVGFWTEGRTLALAQDYSVPAMIPESALGWLSTGDWNSQPKPGGHVSSQDAVQTYFNGTQERATRGSGLHCLAGPARIGGGGTEWFAHGARHRDDGPAVMRANSNLEWWTHGHLVEVR